MALFTGIGDFFRGVFGEDAEEKKRRKQREAQEAAARKQQAKQTRPQVQQSTQQSVFNQGLETKKPTQVQQPKQLFQTQQPAPKPPTVTKPAPQVQPQPKVNYQDLGGVKDVADYYGSDLRKLQAEMAKGDKADQKMIAGLKKSLDNRRKELTEFQQSKGKFNVAETTGVPEDDTKKFGAFVQQRRQKAKQLEIDKTQPIEISAGNGNKAKFTVAQYATYLKSQPKEQQVQILKGLTQQAEQDQGSREMLAGLERNGALEGDLGDFYQGFIDKTGGAFVRAGQRLAATGVNVADKALPGNWQGTEDRLNKAADELDEDAKNTYGYYTRSGRSGRSAGTGTKAAIDIATLFGGTAAASASSKAPAALENGGRAARILGNIIKEVPGSLAGTGISAAQTRGRGDEQNLARDAAIGLVIDAAMPGAGSIFRRLFRGGAKNVDEAAELVAREIDDANALERNIADRTRRVEEAAQNQPDLVPKTERQLELESIVNDESSPAFIRQEARQELDDIVRAADTGDAIDVPTFQYHQQLQQIAEREQDALNRYVNSSPDLTQQQIEQAREEAQARVTKLAEDLRNNRYGTEQAVADQAAQVDEAVQTQQATNADVAAEQQARTEPVPGSEAATPEMQANNGYSRPTTDEELYASAPKFEERGRLSIPQLISPDRIIRENITRPGENLVNRAASAMQTGNSRIGRFFGRMGTGFSRELGIVPDLQTARMQLRGGIEKGKVDMQTIGELGGNMDKDQLADVWATIDTEQAAKMGRVVDPASLTPEQQALRQKLVNIRDNTTAENMRRGLITKEQAANGEYLTRDYSVLYEPGSEIDKFERGFRTELLNQYKGRKLVSQEMIDSAITDPAYLVGKKQAQSEAAWAMQDYGNFLVKNGSVVDAAQPGYVQLPNTPLFGDAAGKFVPKNLAEDFTGFQYDMAMVSAFNDMISAYDRLGIRQAKKALLTVFNPAVRLGNQVTNRGIFSQLAGINPVQFNLAMQAAKKEVASNGQLYREAVEQGLTGVDITQAEFFTNRVAGAVDGDKNMIKKAFDWTKNSYSGADDQARIAAYMVKRQQGYDPVEAARQVQRGFQDYKSVGFFYDMAAKTPIIGNAFVRFAADSVRIAKNAALDHPLRTMGTIAAWSAFVNGMSVLSGESEVQGDNAASKAFNLVTGKSKSEAQKERENRFGAPKLPFTDISTAVQTPFGEVNVARFMPWYQLNEIQGAGLERVMPIQSPFDIKDGKFELNAQAMQDPLLGQLIQLGMDEDFRGKSIRDPNANEDKYAMAPLSGEDQAKNVLRFLFNNNAPEIDQTAAAYSTTGLPGSGVAKEATGGKDIYGRERNIWQALARDMGFKIEQQGEEQRKDRTAIKAYMEDKAEIDKELEGMSPAAQEAWKRLTGYYKLREQVPNEFKPGEERDKKAAVYNFGEDKWKDYAAHPELYELMVQKKQRENARNGKPIPPEFDARLGEAFRKQLIQNKMVAPGDDAELDQRMYSTPEWDYYMQLKDAYKAEAAKYYPQSDKENFDDETVAYDDEKFPDKPPILKAYSAEYKNYLDGKREKPQWSDQLTAAKEAYNKTTLDWTNKAREKRGLPAITWEVWNNPTFGFDESPSGFGFGFGGGGGGGSRDINTLSRLTNYGDDVKRYAPIEAEAMPNTVALFQKLLAGGSGGRAKPKLGASSSGRG